MNLVFRNSNSSAFKTGTRNGGSTTDLPDDSSTLGSNEAEPPNPSKGRSGSNHSSSSTSSDRSGTSPSSSHMVHSHSKQSNHTKPHHHHQHHKNHSNDKKKKRALNFLNNIPTEHRDTSQTNHHTSIGMNTLKTATSDSSSGSGGSSRNQKITTSSPPNLFNNATRLSPRPRGHTASKLESSTSPTGEGKQSNKQGVDIVVTSATTTTTVSTDALDPKGGSKHTQTNSSSKLTVNIPKGEPKTLANPITEGSTNDQLTNKTSHTNMDSNDQDKKLTHDHRHHHRYNQLHHPHPKHHHHKSKTKALDFLSNIPMKKVDSFENIQEKDHTQKTTLAMKTSPQTSANLRNVPKFLKPINSLDDIFDSTNESPDIENQKETDESNEDDYIRRIHFLQKNSPMPFLVCSFIKPKKNPNVFAHPNSSTGSTPLPASATSIPTACSPVIDLTLIDSTLTVEELISKQMELEAISMSKKPTSYRSYILEPVKCEVYDPLYLDDPNIRTASKRKVMTFPGLITSTIPFLKSKVLKKDLNEQFRQQHEHCLLTLSKIRKLKRKILKVILREKPDELNIAALAFVYLEKMILKNLVHKTNRKRIAAACLFLAYKMTIESGHEERKNQISNFLDEIENVFEVARKKVVQTEFFIMSEGLHFNMNIEPKDIQPHLHRLLDEDQDRQGMITKFHPINRV